MSPADSSDQTKRILVVEDEDAVERVQRRAEEERQREEAEQRRKEQVEQQARERRRRRLDEYHELLARDFERMAADWARAKQLHEFLDAYEKSVPVEQRGEVARAWLGAVRQYAHRHDPLTEPEQVPKPFELPDEELEERITELKEAERARTHGR